VRKSLENAKNEGTPAHTAGGRDQGPGHEIFSNYLGEFEIRDPTVGRSLWKNVELLSVSSFTVEFRSTI
jgi:hypothetical protein